MKPFDPHPMRHGPPVRMGLMPGHCGEPAASDGHARLIGQAQALSADIAVGSDLRRAADGARPRNRNLPLGFDCRVARTEFRGSGWMRSGARRADALHRFWSDPDPCPPPGRRTMARIAAKGGRRHRRALRAACVDVPFAAVARRTGGDLCRGNAGHYLAIWTVPMCMACFAPEFAMQCPSYGYGPAGWGRIGGQSATSPARGSQIAVPLRVAAREFLDDG